MPLLLNGDGDGDLGIDHRLFAGFFAVIENHEFTLVAAGGKPLFRAGQKIQRGDLIARAQRAGLNDHGILNDNLQQHVLVGLAGVGKHQGYLIHKDGTYDSMETREEIAAMIGKRVWEECK